MLGPVILKTLKKVVVPACMVLRMNREGAENSGGKRAGPVPATGNTGRSQVPASAGTSESDHSGT